MTVSLEKQLQEHWIPIDIIVRGILILDQGIACRSKIGSKHEGVYKMIKVYSNYVACDTHAEAIEAQTIITNAMCHIPKICNDGDMFLVQHELGEYKMQELLNKEVNMQVGLTTR